jgi:nitrite reductase/ring-hydroxylating ferredoxin subunit
MKMKVADLSALPDDKGYACKAGTVSLVLIKSQDRVSALENKCPHLGLPLARGKIEDGQIVCPFHGSRFNIETGANTDWVCSFAGLPTPVWTRALLAMGKKPKPVRRFPVSIENGAIFVDV